MCFVIKKTTKSKLPETTVLFVEYFKKWKGWDCLELLFVKVGPLEGAFCLWAFVKKLVVRKSPRYQTDAIYWFPIRTRAAQNHLRPVNIKNKPIFVIVSRNMLQMIADSSFIRSLSIFPNLIIRNFRHDTCYLPLNVLINYSIYETSKQKKVFK